jgi:hypothetical protein
MSIGPLLYLSKGQQSYADRCKRGGPSHNHNRFLRLNNFLDRLLELSACFHRGKEAHRPRGTAEKLQAAIDALSLMPAEKLDVFTAEELADLLDSDLATVNKARQHLKKI